MILLIILLQFLPILGIVGYFTHSTFSLILGGILGFISTSLNKGAPYPKLILNIITVAICAFIIFLTGFYYWQSVFLFFSIQPLVIYLYSFTVPKEYR